MSTTNNRKRKQPPHARGRDRWAATNEQDTHRAPDPTLFIQAHEADVVRGPQAHAAAGSLEVSDYEDNGKHKLRIGDALIRWQGTASRLTSQAGDDEEELVTLGHAQPAKPTEGDDGEGLWMDRYDARLLLDALPTVPPDAPPDAPSSPGGWSDLPSDTEDTFFFSPDEVEDYRRDKRRRLIDQGREDRLRALRSEAGAEADPQLAEEQWGGSDEEPDEAHRDLMRRTASHVLSSPNPAQLEMRILANHGADGRFAFLKGRWSRAWRLAKTHARMDKEQTEARQAQPNPGLGGLAGYGGSDSEADSDPGQSEEAAEDKPDEADSKSPVEVPDDVQDDDAKAARRARAKEWAEKRRLAQAAFEGGT
ncbi:uncharacterized protein C8Q71DRAFT_480363 [Rhodofomes roseus]|uniref:Uncharacterized protein n=1 Tax=Rhodofomes roseus TaxID=34475 RepID=A0ABQ8KPC3_9APHY|nr:uncharacterized protein C8Q71DRAFT_480363 [Rhodofomes roseus]KAH9840176.1 hypothetical protein C8Q71DRAFT_480363 [Rhodofomes roseus]